MTLQDIIVNLRLNAEQFVAGAQSALGSWEAASGKMVAGGAILTAGVTAPIVGLGMAAYSMATQLQTAEIGFTTMLGSADEAGKHLEQLKTFAAETPFEFVDLVKASQRMQALGFSAEQVIPNLTAIGNAAAGLGGGADLINRLTLALGQMQAKGKVSGEEMRQLAEAGIPAWQMLAKAAGMSVAEAQEAARKGVFEVDKVLPVLIQGMNDKFGGLMESFSGTVMGKLSNLQDNIGFIMGDIGKTLMPMLNDLLDAYVIPLAEGLKELANWFAGLPGPVQKTIVGVLALVAGIGPLIAMAGALGLALSGVATLLGVSGIAGVAGVVASALPPVAIAVGAVAAAFALWQLEPVRNAVQSVWETVQGFWTGTLQPFLSTLWEFGEKAVAVGAAVASVALPLYFEALAFQFNVLWEAAKLVWEILSTSVVAVFETLKGQAEGLWQILGPLLGAAFEAIAWQAEGVAKVFGFIFGPAIDAVVTALSTLFEWIMKIPGVSSLVDKLSGSLEEVKTKVSAALKPSQDLDKATEDLGDSAKKAGPKVEKAGISIAGAGKEAKYTVGEFQKFEDRLRELGDYRMLAFIRRSEEMEDKQRKLQDRVIDLTAKMQEQEESGWDLYDAFGDMLTAVQGADQGVKDAAASVGNLSTEFLNAISPLNQLNAEINQFETDLGTVGVTAAATRQTVVSEMLEAAERLQNDPRLTDLDKKTALYNALKAQYDLAVQLGEDIPAEQKKTLDQLEKDLKADLPTKIENPWKNSITQVSTAITNAAQSMVGILIGAEEGSVSDALKKLAQGVLSSFVEPAIGYLNTFIEQGIKKLIGWLIGGTGVGEGLLGALGSIGDAIGKIFGGGGGTADWIASSSQDIISNVPGPPAGTGAGGAAASGVMGALTMVGSLGSMVTGIISNVQNAKQETTLNAIEHNTRYSMMFLGERADQGILGQMFRVGENTEYTYQSLDSVKTSMWNVEGWVKPVAEIWIPKMEGWLASINAKMGAPVVATQGSGLESAEAVPVLKDLAWVWTPKMEGWLASINTVIESAVWTWLPKIEGWLASIAGSPGIVTAPTTTPVRDPFTAPETTLAPWWTYGEGDSRRYQDNPLGSTGGFSVGNSVFLPYMEQHLGFIKTALLEMQPALDDLAWVSAPKIESHLLGILTSLVDSAQTVQDVLVQMTRVGDNTFGMRQLLGDFAPDINHLGHLEGILDGITGVQAELRRVIEVNVTGFGSNREVGEEIARAMKAQGALP